MTETELKTCPQCKGHDVSANEHDGLHWVACNECLFSTKSHTTKEGAVSEWNSMPREGAQPATNPPSETPLNACQKCGSGDLAVVLTNMYFVRCQACGNVSQKCFQREYAVDVWNAENRLPIHKTTTTVSIGELSALVMELDEAGVSELTLPVDWLLQLSAASHEKVGEHPAVTQIISDMFAGGEG